MGNMLESDSSASDLENNEDIKERTAGDGMESGHITNVSRASNNDAFSASRQETIRDHNGMKQLNEEHKLDGRPTFSYDVVHDKNDNVQNVEGAKIQNVEITSKLEGPMYANSISTAAKPMSASSPRQLPSRDLLIPVRPPPRLDNKHGASGQSSAYSPSSEKLNVKQKNPKFVPYEPYSAATRPIVAPKTHIRKPSDTSSIKSQSSTVSHGDTTSVTTEEGKLFSNADLSKSVSPCRHDGIHSSKVSSNNNGGTQYHHPSTTLMKERLKMAHKEINDLQSENTRLKKLLVDSMSGSSLSPNSMGRVGVNGPMNQNAQTTNFHHRNNECVDNLNDELEVWRSKFLSSCVLVDQLTKDNHDLKGTVYEAAEIIKDLKNTASLTQGQYENINEWLRKTNNMYMTYSSSTLPDSNFCGEDYLEDANS